MIMSKLFVKICGLTRAVEAKAIANLGVDAIGMILHANSPRAITVETAREIRSVVPSNVQLVGVVVNANLEKIQSLVDQIGLDMIQLHGDENHDFAKQLSTPYIKAIRPRTITQSENGANTFSSAEAILIDPYVKGKYGGTGHTLRAELWPTNVSKPLILAGGLDPENVVERALELKPWGVDLNSGLEIQPGRKSLDKVTRALNGLKRLR